MTIHILFYVGQRVKCVNDRGAETSITAGRFYTVKAFRRESEGWGIEVIGPQRVFRAERFKPRSVADTEIDRQSWRDR